MLFSKYIQFYGIFLILIAVCAGKLQKQSKQNMMIMPERASSTIEDILAPIMMGVLLKLLAIIPIVLFKLSIMGIMSLLGSKISILMSAGGMIKKFFFGQNNQNTNMNMPASMPPDMMMISNTIPAASALTPMNTPIAMNMMMPPSQHLIPRTPSATYHYPFTPATGVYYKMASPNQMTTTMVAQPMMPPLTNEPLKDKLRDILRSKKMFVNTLLSLGDESENNDTNNEQGPTQFVNGHQGSGS